MPDLPFLSLFSLADELQNLWLSLKNFIKSVSKTALPHSFRSVKQRQISGYKQPKKKFLSECHHLTASNFVSTMCWDNRSKLSCTISGLPQLQSNFNQHKGLATQWDKAVTCCRAVTCWARAFGCSGTGSVSLPSVALAVTPAPQAPTKGARVSDVTSRAISNLQLPPAPLSSVQLLF